MSVTSFPPHTLESVADQYARTRMHRDRPLVMSAAILRIRTVIPNAQETDEALTAIIATKAIACGLAVDFDGERPKFH